MFLEIPQIFVDHCETFPDWEFVDMQLETINLRHGSLHLFL